MRFVSFLVNNQPSFWFRVDKSQIFAKVIDSHLKPQPSSSPYRRGTDVDKLLSTDIVYEHQPPVDGRREN